MSISTGLAVWKTAFQLSPILLAGGVANVIGGLLPLVAVTEALNFPDGLLSGQESLDLDDFFANFEPLPGATLINQDLARYTFGNQAVAANAVIQQPLTVSMRMVTTAQGDLAMFLKLAIFTALQAVLQAHDTSGGTYVVMTPAYVYTNCVLRALRDTSSGQTRQPQNAWTFDFEQPLIALSSIQAAQSSLMSLITNGSTLSGQTPGWSGVVAAGGTTTGGVSTSLIPSVASAAAGNSGTIALPGFASSVAPGQVSSAALPAVGGS